MTPQVDEEPSAAVAPSAGAEAPTDRQAPACPSLQQQGWAQATGVFDAEEVAGLRAALGAAFSSSEGFEPKVPAECGRVLSDLFTRPQVYPRFFTDRLFSAVTRLAGGGLVLLPEHSAHRNAFGVWHKDTDMFERSGLMQHWAAHYEVFQCAVYLQDNSAATGGGLSVVPGSHRVPRPRSTLVDAAQRDSWFAAQTAQVLDSTAGDLVIFDTRLDHRATPRTEQATYGDKLALFFVAARNNAYAALYSQFIHRRPDYAYLDTYRVPPEVQALAVRHGMPFVV